MKAYWFRMYGNSCDGALCGRLRRVGDRDAAPYEALVGKRFSYRWDDGWWIGISVERVDDREYRRLAKAKMTDMGYGWMIDNIMKYGSPKDADEALGQFVKTGKGLA